MLTEQELMREAADSGFQREPFEKVMRLAELLESLRSHPYLKSRLVLKGGTALNLFVFDVPRLSVDVDLNYIGASDQETMVAERPKLEQAIQAVCGRLGVQVKRVPPDHAGGKWRLSYRTVSGRPAMLELDLNFMMRTPLWAPRVVDSHQLGLISARQIPVLDLHELAAGKLAALFARNASRDLFDVHQLLQRDDLDHSRLRFGFLVYGGINRRDWRELSIEDVAADSREVHQQLIPMLRSHAAPKEADLEAWTRRLVSECRDLLSAVLPLDPHEIEFLDRLNDRGEIVPELLTPLEDRQKIVRSHPGLLWKALNVRRHRGLDQHKL